MPIFGGAYFHLTPEEAHVPLNCDRFARSSCFCGCANAFCRHVPALEFNFHDVIAEIGNVLRKNRTSGRMATRLAYGWYGLSSSGQGLCCAHHLGKALHLAAYISKVKN